MAGIRLVVGLGNPGADYAQTRHNAGFWLLDQFIKQEPLAGAGGSFHFESKFNGEVARAANDVWLLKPQTFMNLSGDAVGALARFYRIEAAEILVAHDELDLPCGTVRLKSGGGDGGHNGLKDISQKLGSGDYHRLRIGIGHPGARTQVTPHVLNRANAEDQRAIEQAISAALAEMPRLLQGEISAVMNALNRRTLPPMQDMLD